MISKMNTHPTPLTAELEKQCSFAHMLQYWESTLLLSEKRENCDGGHFYLIDYSMPEATAFICRSKKILQCLFIKITIVRELFFQSAHNSIGMSIFSSLLTKGTMNLTTGKCTSLAVNCHIISQTVVYSPLTEAYFF